MVILDTNIIVDHLRLQGTGKSFLRKLEEKLGKEQLAISLISIQELYSGQSTKDPGREEYLLATIGSLQILPYTYETAELAGVIARDLKQPIELADAAIAATTIVNGAELVSLNKKHFKGIPALRLFE